MASLIYTFSDLYSAVISFLGTDSSSSDDIQQAKNIVHDAYRRFLNAHQWSFLYPEAQLITVSGQHTYELPEDFMEMAGTFKFDSNTAYPPLLQRDLDWIRDARASIDYTSYPEYFALKPSAYSKEVGQKWEVIFYPTPNAAYTLFYRYRISPPKLENDTDYPVGGPDVAIVLKQLCLAEAESAMDEESGIQEGKAAALLADAIRNDNRKRPHSLGFFGDGEVFNNWELARGSYRVNNVIYIT